MRYIISYDFMGKNKNYIAMDKAIESFLRKAIKFVQRHG